MGDLSFLELGDVPPFTAPAATAAIPGRMSDVNCRDTARVPSCNRFWVGVNNPSIYTNECGEQIDTSYVS